MTDNDNMTPDLRRKALREKYASEGFQSLSDCEIIELLLSYSAGKGFSAQAIGLYEFFGSSYAAANADEYYLRSNFGLDEKSIALLKLLPQLSRLYFMEKGSIGRLSASHAAMNYFEKFFIGAVTEQLAAAAVDKLFAITASSVISFGAADSVNAVLRDIADFALKNRSDRIFIAHNHPAGSPSPSASDISSTDILCRRLKSLGIHLIDHIIVGKFSSLSMRELPTLLPFRDSDSFGYSFERKSETI